MNINIYIYILSARLTFHFGGEPAGIRPVTKTHNNRVVVWLTNRRDSACAWENTQIGLTRSRPYVYIHMYTYVHIYGCMHIYTSLSLSLSIYIYIYIYIHIYLSIYLYIYISG